MAVVRKMQVSFAGGVIAPEAAGRVDLDKYQIGMETCENFVVKAHGAIENRAGTRFGTRAKYADKRSRVIPFEYSNDQYADVEFGDLYIRFHVDGAPVLEAAKNITGVTQASPAVMGVTAHGFAAGEWVYVDGIVGMTELNGRTLKVLNPTTNDFELADLDGVAISSGAYGAYVSGGTVARVYEIASTYTEDEVFEIDYDQNADVVSLAHPNHAPAELQRLGAASWQLVDIDFTASITPPTSVTAAASPASGSKTYSYAVAAVASSRDEESVVQVMSTASATVNVTYVHAGPHYVTVSSTAGLATSNKVFVTGTGVSSVDDRTYKIETISGSNVYLLNADGQYITNWPLGGSAVAGTLAKPDLQNDLTVSGNKNTISWSAVTGAFRYNVYKQSPNSGMYGYIGTTDQLTFVDDNITPDMTQTPKDSINPFNSADNYPAAVAYFNQRRIFGGTNNGPQYCWATTTGSDSDMSASFPPTASDAFSFRIASGKNNRISHIVPLSDLVVLTPGALYRVGSSQGPISANDIVPRVQAYSGASKVRPLKTLGEVVYVDVTGDKINAVSFDWQSQAYSVTDLSILAAHLFDGYTIVDAAFTRGVSPVAWFVRSDGVLLGITYLPDQKVYAWHEHTTDGYFESVSVKNQGGIDRLSFVVKRNVGGADVRFIEHLAIRVDDASEDCFFVDCGLSYDGAATSTLSNLWHLEGKEVVVLGDGAYLGAFTVADGEISLGDVTVEKAHIGLAYSAKMVPLPASSQSLSFGDYINVQRVVLKLLNTRGVKVGVTEAKMYEPPAFVESPYDGVPPLKTGLAEVPLPGDWSTLGQFVVKQDYPLPCTVLAMVVDAARG